MAMYEGNWKCSNCGGAITQLPFQPRSEAGLTCRTCYAKGKEAEKSQQTVPEMPVASEAPPMDDVPDYDESQIASEPISAEEAFAGLEDATPTSGEKQKHEGNWVCSVCGDTISSLPFEPKSTNNLKCLDCYKNSKT